MTWIQVRGRLILLVEAQSTFSVNISLRMLMYLASTYKEYVEEEKLDLYGTRAVTIPHPELYVVYTGTRENVPDTLRLSDLYEGHGSVDLEVKVLQDSGTGGHRGPVCAVLPPCGRECEEARQNGRGHFGDVAGMPGTGYFGPFPGVKAKGGSRYHGNAV